MKTIIFFLILSILFEATITTLPLTLLIILFASIWIKKTDVFLIAFVSGLVLDILTLRSVGWSSAYFVFFVYAIFMYQRKFEIMTLSFVVLAGFIGSLGYALMESVSAPVFQALTCAALSSFSFFVFSKTNKKIFKYA